MAILQYFLTTKLENISKDFLLESSKAQIRQVKHADLCLLAAIFAVVRGSGVAEAGSLYY